MPGLTPLELAKKLPIFISDEPFVIIVLPDKIVRVEKGMYGGYVIKPKQFGLEEFDEDKVREIFRNANIYYVVPDIEDYDLNLYYASKSYREEVLSKVNEAGLFDLFSDVVSELPEIYRNEFESIDSVKRIKVINYTLVPAKARVAKVRDRYAVIGVEPVVDANKYRVKRVLFYTYYRGSRKYPKAHEAPKIVERANLLGVRLPENVVVHGVATSDRSSALILDVITEVPHTIPIPMEYVEVSKNKGKVEVMPVVIKGFLVVSSLPSKALLDAAIPEIFKEKVIGKKVIKLVTGYFYNKLGSLSRKFYTQILPKYAINAGFGYIIPRKNVPGFLKEVDELKKEYEELERQLKEFLLEGKVPQLPRRAKVDPEYFELVLEYLKQQGEDVYNAVREKVKKLDIAGRVRINLLPFAIDYSIIEEYADEQVKKRVEQEIEEMKRDIAEAVREKLEARARAILHIIEKIEELGRQKASEKLFEQLKKKTDELQEIATEFGVKSPLIDMLVDTVRTITTSPDELLIKETSGRLKALIKSLKA